MFPFGQAEACEAGLEPQVLQEWLKELDGREEDALNDLLHKEVQKWMHNCVDVDALQRRVVRAEETCRILSKKVSTLQTQLQQFQLEKLNNYNLEDREKVTALSTKQSPKVSSNAEDEGISSSERSSSPENTKHQLRANHQKINASPDNDQETTIDDVIEELRIIVKDALEEFDDKNHEKNRTDHVADQELSCNDHASKANVYRTNSKISLNNSVERTDYAFDKVLKRNPADAKVTKSNAGSNMSHSVIKGEQVTYFGNDRDCADSSGARRVNSDTRRISKSSVEGSVKIVIKGPDVEDAIVPTILHPQPPRRSPPCLSAIMAVRHCDFVDHEEAYNSHDEEIEEETLGDGSDSLLSASRLKYNGKNQAYEEQVRNSGPVNEFQTQARKGTGNDNDGEVKKSFDDLRHFSEGEVKDKKVARNYESSCGLKSRVTNESRSNRTSDGFVQKHSSKYRSEVEKRKHLRRSTSHDYLDSNASSPRLRRSGRSKVENHIRKFESLNSFDEHRSLQSYGRADSSENLNKQEQDFFVDENSRSRMRRSESFHHVSHVARKDQCSSRGGSDSGLFYVTDFNLEPLVTRRPRSIEAPKSPSLLTKSLDRIDEGLDSMIDIVIMEEKGQWSSSKYQSKTKKSREERQLVRSKSSRLEETRSCHELETKGRKEESRGKHLKSDEFYSGHMNNKQLRSDELYEEQRNREWNCQNELNSAKKNNDLDFDCTPVILTKNGVRHNSFCQNENIGSRLSNISKDSGIFAGRTYDTFGLGKSRFNAGKYSGNQQTKDSPIGRRNTTSSANGNRGKVTDIVSGLY